MGRFILTGSSQFELIESITQSLAGRASMLTLLPFSMAELQAANRAPASVDELLYTGFFPPVYDRNAGHVTAHPQRGALFENWVMTELLKAQTNSGQKPSIYFLRDKEGHEIDAFIETAPGIFQAVEVKSGETVAADSFAGLEYWRSQHSGKTLIPWLVHGGTIHQQREQATILPWNDLRPLCSSLLES